MYIIARILREQKPDAASPRGGEERIFDPHSRNVGGMQLNLTVDFLMDIPGLTGIMQWKPITSRNCTPFLAFPLAVRFTKRVTLFAVLTAAKSHAWHAFETFTTISIA